MSVRRMLPLVVIVALVGCHAPVTIVTPEGKVAYTANEVLKRVEELQKTAIAVAGIPDSGVPLSVTRTIVEFTVSAAKVLDASAPGWGQSLAIAWGDVKRRIPLRYLQDARLQFAVAAVDLALAIFLPPEGGTS